ncbi:carbohydrate kinase family protein [soil metagenome]
MSRILVVGCVSFDTVHLELSGAERRTIQTIGGASLYTALAAAKVGAEVTLFAPKPTPMPDLLKPVEAALTWVGPQINLGQMPTLEIVHHGSDRATLLNASWGAENLLQPDSIRELVESHFDITHIAALSSPARQLEFMTYLKKVKANQVISVGTYARAIALDAFTVKELLAGSDAFFMNKNEANLLYGTEAIVPKDYQLLFVTAGGEGVDLYTSNGDGSGEAGILHEHIEAEVVDVVDPTGAGDSFCGAALAGLTIYINPVAAAQVGCLVASKSIEYEGPSIYFIEDSEA